MVTYKEICAKTKKVQPPYCPETKDLLNTRHYILLNYMSAVTLYNVPVSILSDNTTVTFVFVFQFL